MGGVYIRIHIIPKFSPLCQGESDKGKIQNACQLDVSTEFYTFFG